MTPVPMVADFKRLLRIAHSDLAAANALLQSSDPRIRQEEICLHCHAAMEKVLKGIGYLHGYDPPFTHRLASLAEHVIKNVGAHALPPTFDGNSFSYLDAYSALARYEDLLPTVDRRVAQEAFEAVAKAINELEAHSSHTDAND